MLEKKLLKKINIPMCSNDEFVAVIDLNGKRHKA